MQVSDPYPSELISPALMTLIARFMGPTLGPSRADRTQMGPMLAPLTPLSEEIYLNDMGDINWYILTKKHKNATSAHISRTVYSMKYVHGFILS